MLRSPDARPCMPHNPVLVLIRFHRSRGRRRAIVRFLRDYQDLKFCSCTVLRLSACSWGCCTRPHVDHCWAHLSHHCYRALMPALERVVTAADWLATTVLWCARMLSSTQSKFSIPQKGGACMVGVCDGGSLHCSNVPFASKPPGSLLPLVRLPNLDQVGKTGKCTSRYLRQIRGEGSVVAELDVRVRRQQ